MAKSSSGVTLEFGLEIGKFQSALRKLTGEINSLEKILKEVDKQLKFDPHNMDLLTSKSILLKQKIEELKNEQSKLNDVIKEGEAGHLADDWNENTQKLILAKTELANVNNQLDSSQKELEETEKALKGYGEEQQNAVQETNLLSLATEKLGDFFVSKLAKGVEKAWDKLIELTKEAVKASAQLEYLADDLEALYGNNVTATGMQELTKYAKDLSTQTTYSAETIMQSMSFMARAGYDAEQTIASVKSALDLSMATGEDATRLSSYLVDGLTAFQMSADEASRFANVLAVTANETNADVSDLGESFKYAGSMAGTFGYEVEDVAVALGIMAQNGIKGSQAGTTLRSMFTRLATNTGKAREELESIGVEFFDVNGNARDLNTVLEEMREAMQGMTDEQLTESLKKIAGQNGISGLTAIVSASEEEWQKLKSAISDTSGYIEEIAEVKTDNLQSDVIKLKNAWTQLSTDAVQPLLPAFRTVVQGITKAFTTLDGAITDTTWNFEGFSANIKQLEDNMSLIRDRLSEQATAYELNIEYSRQYIQDIVKINEELATQNLTDEETAKRKEEIKQKIDAINKSLGETIYHYDEETGKILDENGEVVNLGESYETLAEQKRKAFYLEKYEKAYEEAIRQETEAVNGAIEAYDKWYESTSGLKDGHREMAEEYAKYGSDYTKWNQDIYESYIKLDDVERDRIQALSLTYEEVIKVVDGYKEQADIARQIVEDYEKLESAEGEDFQAIIDRLSNPEVYDYVTAEIEELQKTVELLHQKIADPNIDETIKERYRKQLEFAQQELDKRQEIINKYDEETKKNKESVDQKKKDTENAYINDEDSIVNTSKKAWDSAETDAIEHIDAITGGYKTRVKKALETDEDGVVKTNDTAWDSAETDAIEHIDAITGGYKTGFANALKNDEDSVKNTNDKVAQEVSTFWTDKTKEIAKAMKTNFDDANNNKKDGIVAVSDNAWKNIYLGSGVWMDKIASDYATKIMLANENAQRYLTSKPLTQTIYITTEEGTTYKASQTGKYGHHQHVVVPYSDGLGIASGGIGITANIHVTNNGAPINDTEISRWVNVMADKLDVAIGRRM